jgi:hypothetical protein
LNPLLSGFSADDWQILSTQALALAKMRRQLRYVGLVLQKKG